MEKRHLFANKLYIAEMNREKELQKKLDIIRQHVGFLFLLNNFIFLLSVLYYRFKITKNMLLAYKYQLH